MTSEAEAYIIIRVLVLVALGAICLLFLSLTFGYFWIKQYTDETRTFIKLMIGLYEKEREKNEKTDEGGFGT